MGNVITSRFISAWHKHKVVTLQRIGICLPAEERYQNGMRGNRLGS